MIGILSFLLSPLGRIVAAGLGIVAFLFAFGFDQRSKGAANAVAKIEKANSDAVSKAHSARSSSAFGGGLRDPHAID